jgi:hypothetical protein
VRRQVRIVASRLVFAPPKTGKTRDVPLPESVALRLAAHLEAWPAVPATRDNGMHAARHYYASALLEDGVSIRAVA